MAFKEFDFDDFQWDGSPPPWTSTYKYRSQRDKHNEDPTVDASDAVRYVWSILTEVTCLECEHFRQDSDDGTICQRCDKGQCVLLSDGKKKKRCMHFDKMTT